MEVEAAAGLVVERLWEEAGHEPFRGGEAGDRVHGQGRPVRRVEEPSQPKFDLHLSQRPPLVVMVADGDPPLAEGLHHPLSEEPSLVLRPARVVAGAGARHRPRPGCPERAHLDPLGEGRILDPDRVEQVELELYPEPRLVGDPRAREERLRRLGHRPRGEGVRPLVGLGEVAQEDDRWRVAGRVHAGGGEVGDEDEIPSREPIVGGRCSHAVGEGGRGEFAGG